MRHFEKILLMSGLAAALLLSGCASTSPAFRAEQQSVISAEMGITQGELATLSRCQFDKIPLGQSVANFRAGVCASTGSSVIVRSYDMTTGTSRAFASWTIKDLESASLHSGVLLDQVQVRLGGEMLVMIMRPDGGGGFNNGAAKDLFEHLSKSGVSVVESKSAVGFAATGAQYVPIFIPMKR